MYSLTILIYGIIFGFVLYGLNWFRNILIFRKKLNKYPGRPANFFIGDVLYMSRKLGKFLLFSIWLEIYRFIKYLLVFKDVLFKQVRGFAKEFPEGYRLWSGFFGAYNFIKAVDVEVIFRMIFFFILIYFLQFYFDLVWYFF